MHRTAVFVNDPAYARRLLSPFLQATAEPSSWIFLPCAPRLPRRVGRWLTSEACERFAHDWANRLRSDLEVTLKFGRDDQIEWVTPRETLASTIDGLRSKYGTSTRLLDARCQRLGRPNELLVPESSPPQPSAWGMPAAVASTLSVVLALSD